jgi:hypothetical protein
MLYHPASSAKNNKVAFTTDQGIPVHLTTCGDGGQVQQVCGDHSATKQIRVPQLNPYPLPQRGI